jgi:hypothetical protein
METGAQDQGQIPWKVSKVTCETRRTHHGGTVKREKDTRSRGVSKNRSRAEWILIWSRGKAMRAALLRSVSFEV